MSGGRSASGRDLGIEGDLWREGICVVVVKEEEMADRVKDNMEGSCDGEGVMADLRGSESRTVERSGVSNCIAKDASNLITTVTRHMSFVAATKKMEKICEAPKA